MQTWYFLVIGLPIVTSFVISLTVFLVYAKLLEREHLPNGKTRFRCKQSKTDQQVQKVVPNTHNGRDQRLKND